MEPDRRFPRSVYREGSEPDPRFSLANERTFLAWIRTALAVLATGVALEALEVPVERSLRLGAAAILVAMAVLAVGQAWFGWMRIERSLRRGAPLPSATVAPVVAAGIILASVLIAIGYVANR